MVAGGHNLRLETATVGSRKRIPLYNTSGRKKYLNWCLGSKEKLKTQFKRLYFNHLRCSTILGLLNVHHTLKYWSHSASPGKIFPFTMCQSSSPLRAFFSPPILKPSGLCLSGSFPFQCLVLPMPTTWLTHFSQLSVDYLDSLALIPSCCHRQGYDDHKMKSYTWKWRGIHAYPTPKWEMADEHPGLLAKIFEEDVFERILK